MSTPESTIECPNCGKKYDPIVYPTECPRCGEEPETPLGNSFEASLYEDDY